MISIRTPNFLVVAITGLFSLLMLAEIGTACPRFTWLEYLSTQTDRQDEIGEVAREVIAKFQSPEAEARGLTAGTADTERLLLAIKYFIDLHFGEEMSLRLWQEYASAIKRLN